MFHLAEPLLEEDYRPTQNRLDLLARLRYLLEIQIAAAVVAEAKHSFPRSWLTVPRLSGNHDKGWWAAVL